jgi:hypothetical protein
MSPYLVLGIDVSLILGGLAIGSLVSGVRMPWLLRVPVALLVLALAAFCSFGFLATFEPSGFPAMRVVYGTVGIASLIGAGWLLSAERAGS